MKQTNWKALIASLFIFTGVFYLIRWPFLSLPLVGEDGIFASLLIDQPSKPAMNLFARINNQNIYGDFGHPLIMYSWLKKTAWLLNPLLKFNQGNEKIQTIKLRIFFSLFQLSAWSMLLIASKLSQKRQTHHFQSKSYLMILTLSLSLAAVVNSIELQMDTSIGVLIVAIYISIQIVKDSIGQRNRYFLIFISAALFGFGKNEWAFMFILAQVTYPIISKIVSVTWNKKEVFINLMGVSFGSFLCYLYDPANYMQGWRLMTGMSRSQSIVGKSSIEWFLYTNYMRLPYTYIHLAVLGLLTLILLLNYRNKHLKSTEIQTYIVAASLFAPFFLSTWGIYPRYFAPSLIALAGALIIIHEPYIKKEYQRFFMAVASLVLLISIVQSNRELGKHLKLRNEGEKKYQSQQGACVPVVDTGIAYFIDKDFVGSSLDKKNQLQLVHDSDQKICSKID